MQTIKDFFVRMPMLFQPAYKPRDHEGRNVFSALRGDDLTVHGIANIGCQTLSGQIRVMLPLIFGSFSYAETDIVCFFLQVFLYCSFLSFRVTH